MRLRASFSLLLASAGIAAAVAASPPDARPRPPALRGGQCLDPDFTRDFTALDDHRLLVDNGRHRYLVEVSRSCWNLRHTAFIGFRGDPVTNRVCGSRLDAIITSDRVPCRIERMHLLSREEYRQVLAQHRADKLARRAQRKASRGQ